MKEKQECPHCSCKWITNIPDTGHKIVACPKCHAIIKEIGGKKSGKKKT